VVKKKFTMLYYLLSLAAGGILTLFIEHSVNTSKADTAPISGSGHENTNDNYSIKRNNSQYKFIAPILLVELKNESEKFAGIKDEINNYIEQEKQKGLTSAAVYFKEYSNDEWFSINGKERYDPGSLLKVGVLMTYLRMAEDDNNLLNKEIVYHGQKGFTFPVEHYQSDTVAEGHKYKINELLQSMIINSDNRATVFLEDHMDTGLFKREFNDLGISEPRFNDPNFTLNVVEYSNMFRALHNAGYLRKRASEDALTLLSESTFKDGLRKGLPASVVVAHKYGEYGNRISHELHDAGIIYLNNKPYLLSVMTRGTDWNELSDVIGHISKIVYNYELLAANNQP
jgi:beta-lactamase class A